MIFRGGPNVYGAPIGILGLETYYAKLPGHVKNASTFNYPVVYKIVPGAVVERLLHSPDPALLAPFVEAVKELEAEGVRAIAGSCGFLAAYQKELADAVSIPLFTSSLLLVPLVSRLLKKGQMVGVVTASKRGLTPEHLIAVGCENVPMVIAGMDTMPEFREVILENRRIELDGDKLQDEIVSVAVEMVENHRDIGAVVLECTEMPVYAHLIQQQTNLPVFDLITLTDMVCAASLRVPFRGIMPL
ncbi:MAG: aspartate/glutamate racemase family protein [Desulfuromonadales bacterium]|nr:aspartate/glutamate racemase family protein [Desulfuromonadales bacterium]